MNEGLENIKQIEALENKLNKILELCNEELENTEINSIDICEDTHDHYLLGKVDLSNAILILINK